MKNLFYITGIFLLFSCGKKQLSPSEMVKWTEDPGNQLVHKKTFNGIEYSLQYLPAGYLALREQATVSSVNKKQFVTRLGELEQYHHFQLRLRVPGVNTDPLLYGISDQQEYTQRDMFYGFAFKEHIKKVNTGAAGKDTVNCQLYQFVQHHGLAPYADIVFAFSKEEKEEQFQVVFDDPVFNNGFMKYTFTAEEINHLPEVKI